jgi:type I restriction enzyme, S subunit
LTPKPSERLGAYFRSRREKGKAGLPTISVTLDRGLVLRDSIDRKMETNLSPDEHLRVYPGDIAYNMMRMWQGASGIADADGIVSPAYVVLAPKPNVDPLFASYLFKTSEMIHRFWAFSYGLTDDRLRLYPRDFTLIPATRPPLPEQQKIAGILGTWDKAIETTEALLANARTQKRALMQSLLTGTRRFPGFDDHPWREVRLGDVVRLSKDRLDPTRPHNARRCIELEHIEGETGRLIGETASDQQASIKAVFEPGDILFGKLRPYLRKFHAPDFPGVCSTEIWVLKPIGSALTSEFLHLIVQGDGFMEEASRSSGSKMPRAEWGVVADYRMMLPVIEEQKQIASVLQDADREVDHLTSQLTHLRTEKKSLMQQLLTGKRRVVV